MKLKGMVLKKEGMTRIFKEEDKSTSVTVLNGLDCTIVGFREKEREGYDAAQLGIFEVPLEKLNKPQAGVFKKKGLEKGFKRIVEVPVVFENGDDLKSFIGKRVKVEEVFQGTESVDIIGLSKGRGFQGVVKRWGFAGGPKSHGSSLFHRRPGSIGSTTYPGRVLKGKKLPGQMGNERRTNINLKVVDILKDENLLLVKGGVVGSRGSLLIVKESTR